jgi:hypothetical protein
MTIHGTFEPNGAVFCDLPGCIDYCAEPIFTGEHAGQIAITITNANYNEDCNDTFYGCLDFSTHKFQVEIPDDCCLSICESCSDVYSSVNAIFSGVSQCGCILQENEFATWSAKLLQNFEPIINASHILDWKGIENGYCLWEKKVETNDYTFRYYYPARNCSGSYIDYISSYWIIKIQIEPVMGHAHLWVSFWINFIGSLGSGSSFPVWVFGTGGKDVGSIPATCFATGNYPMNNLLTNCFIDSASFHMMRSGHVNLYAL